MPQKSVFCFAPSRIQADYIVARLKAAHFSSDDISALSESPRENQDLEVRKQSWPVMGAFAGAALAGLFVGAQCWIAGAGAVSISDISSVFDARPWPAALICVGAGTVIGGISGALFGMNASREKGRHEEAKLNHGEILISVHARNSAEITRAEMIFACFDAHGIGTAGELV